MHSVMAHQHHSELDYNEHIEAHESATSFLDFIKLAFHVDLGEDHLEDYEVVQQAELNFDLFVTTVLDISFDLENTTSGSQQLFVFQEKLHSQYLSRHLSLRGPPTSI